MTSSPVQAQRGTDERERLADWLEMVATQSDDGRKKEPNDKRRLAANMLRADAEQLRARDEEIAALRKDAERLDWLGRGYKTCSVSMDGTSRFSPTNAVYNMRGETFRDAIDNAALQEKSRDAG